MEVDSDSDSDSSHISATPPRKPSNSSRLPKSPSLRKSGARPFPPPKDEGYKLRSCKRKRPRKPSLTMSPTDSLTPVQPPDLSTFSPKIRRVTGGDSSVSASILIEQVPAGYFTNSSSFCSRFKSRKLSFESDEVEANGHVVLPTEVSASRSDFDSRDCTASPAVKGVGTVEDGRRAVNARIHPNSICNDLCPAPVVRPKPSSGGNFVRLNINGYNRKFPNNGGRRKCSSFAARSKRYGRSKGKGRGNNKTEIETVHELGDDEGLVVDVLQQEAERRVNSDNELLNQAIMAAREFPSDDNLKNLLKMTHGYDSFREGQLEAIKKVLKGQSTMLILPTGGGKSLCYQLPALILPGITLVISPLVALMVDQLRQLPLMLPGGLLCSSQTIDEASDVLDGLCRGSLKVLFVSPERFLNAEFLSKLVSIPLISLVVVDEAHCLSEWSHNFRPSYLRLGGSLFETKLNVACVLAMTATATAKTLHTILAALRIPPTNLINISQIRENLQLHVTSSVNREKDLMMLMRSSLNEISSIIIYCKFQSQADMLSKFLCDNSISAKSYHSGILARDRNRIQKLFDNNKIRVVVATVAFGMGLDKSDVGAVIHYSLPGSLEEYVQEIGRAGRDGRLSYCHLLLDDNTYIKLRSLAYSEGVDEYSINKLLSLVFGNNCVGKICSLVKETSARKIDIKEEVILTVLTRLELGELQYIRFLPQLNVTCTLHFHKTSPSSLAIKDILVAAILEKSEVKKGYHLFDVPSVANHIGVTATCLLSHLQKLKSLGEITYELKDLAFCYTIVKSPEDYWSLATCITKWLFEVERSKVQKLDAMYSAAAYATKKCKGSEECRNSLHSSCLKRKILDYFSGNDEITPTEDLIEQNSPFLLADIKVFLKSNLHVKFTPRSVARIMHGIPSPAFPSSVWSRSNFWGRYSHIHFPLVMEAASVELMNFVGKLMQ